MIRLKRELAYEGKLLKVYKDHMQIAGKEACWDFVENKGGAAVVPVTKDGSLVLVRQYRNAIDAFSLEIPGGAFDEANEEGVSCVARELREETGYEAGTISHLVTVHSMVAFCNEKVEVYVAEDLNYVGQHLDEEEEIVVEIVPLSKAKEMIYKGEITDSKTVAGIMAYICSCQSI